MAPNRSIYQLRPFGRRGAEASRPNEWSFPEIVRSGEDCLQDWKRIRPIATMMSSDNKKYININENGKPTPNSIGYRYSWIKMSEPSIESLRQAFLDHESRISCLMMSRTIHIQPNGRDMQRSNRFRSRTLHSMADQEIHFSPNMNCIIGGRGSGKSTLLEYLQDHIWKSQG